MGSIVPNPHQPRLHFDEDSLTELTASIRELGVLQPVLVRPAEDGRLRAHRRRAPAGVRPRVPGCDTIPAIVRTSDDLRSLEQALVENLHRQDLNPLEEAAAYQQLIEDFGLTHDEAGSPGRQEPRRRDQHAAPPPAAAPHPAPAGRRPADRRPRPSPARHPRPSLPGGAGPAGRGRGLVGARGRGGGPGPSGPNRTTTRADAKTASSVELSRGRACALPGCWSWRSCSSDYLDTRVRRDDGGQAGQGRGRVRDPRGPRADLPSVTEPATPA